MSDDAHGLAPGDSYKGLLSDVLDYKLPADCPVVDYVVSELTDNGFKLKTASQCVTYDPSTIRVEWASDPAKASDEYRATRTLPRLTARVSLFIDGTRLEPLKSIHREIQRQRRKWRAARKRRRGWA